MKSYGIEPYIIDLSSSRSIDGFSEFFASEYLVIAIPPRVKYQNDFKKQIDFLIPFIEQSSINKVIFISSTSVYPSTDGLVTENYKGLPESKSGMVLLEVERLFHRNKFFLTTTLRMAGLYGYDRQPGRFLAGKKELTNENGKVNLIHQDDCIQIIFGVLENQLWGDVFNCCSDEHPTRKEFYTKAALKQGLEPPEFILEEKSTFKIISNEKVKHALNYRFIHPDPMTSD